MSSDLTNENRSLGLASTNQRGLALGFTLIEVLISVFIISFSLLSITLLSSGVLTNIRDSYFRSLAVLVLSNGAEKFSAGDSNCLSWHDDYVKLLPGADGSCQRKNNTCELSLCFQNAAAQAECFRLQVLTEMKK